eukprot:gnl/MRDRNA2_/MRDRNA2_104353_c0_seq1.p1 gnl/MRDRNA2_/MRDRNA2_104353_c0~~gnl/MRDRNA2_/MRDRNA2_104353_c0_seq1.p1  ORF type:complete len:235 (-),score=68.03 gnl/MRDRNA2_/MRDRNA2_104353_c0_seq1:63-767(-)
MMRVFSFGILPSLCLSVGLSSPDKQPVSSKQVEDDLKALDVADQDLASRVKTQTVKGNAPKDPVVPAKAHVKASRPKHASRGKGPHQLPDPVSQKSKLWSHESDLTVGAAAEEVLDKGDEMARKLIQSRKEKERMNEAPAKVTLVSDEGIDRNKEEDLMRDSSKSLDEDLQDLKAKEVEDEQVIKNEEQHKAKQASIPEKTATPTPGPKPAKRANLDRLLKLSRTMQSDAATAK